MTTKYLITYIDSPSNDCTASFIESYINITLNKLDIVEYIGYNCTKNIFNVISYFEKKSNISFIKEFYSNIILIPFNIKFIEGPMECSNNKMYDKNRVMICSTEKDMLGLELLAIFIGGIVLYVLYVIITRRFPKEPNNPY